MSDQPDRLSRLREVMRTEGIDLVALAARMAWLLDVRPHGDERPCIADFAGPRSLPHACAGADNAREQTDMAFYNWADADGPDARWVSCSATSAPDHFPRWCSTSACAPTTPP